MQSSEVEGNVWPDLAAEAVLSEGTPTSGILGRHWPALCWGVSCAVHLLLLVAVGLLTRNLIDVPPAPPIRVSVLPTMETGQGDVVPRSRMPEDREPDTAVLFPVSPLAPDPVPTVAPRPTLPPPTEPERAVTPVIPENPTPEFIEVIPEVRAAREPPPLLEPPQAVRPDLIPPESKPPEPPLTPSPPAVPRAPQPRVLQTSPARELPKRGRPPTTFDDAVLARVPPVGPEQQEAPTATTPGTPTKEQPKPQASPPRSTGARYGQNPTPPYPSEARRRGWEGTVLLMVEIRENGRPERVTIKESSGHSVLDDAALGAVGRWTFVPAQQNGKPVRSVAEVPIIFSLRERR
jgi:periplasmic protein TonB